MSDDDKKKDDLLLPVAIGGVLAGAAAVLALSNKKVRRIAFAALENFLGLKAIEPEPEKPPKAAEGGEEGDQ